MGGKKIIACGSSRDNYHSKREKKYVQIHEVSQEVVEAMIDGDHRAYDIVYMSYKEPVGKYIARITGSAELAEEILQEVFVNIWMKRDQIDPSRNFKTYLYTIAKNSVFNHYRAQDKFNGSTADHSMVHLAGDLMTDNQVIADDIQLAVAIAISNMPELRRRVYEMRAEGAAYDDIAEMLGITQESARKHLSRARSELKELLGVMSFFLY